MATIIFSSVRKTWILLFVFEATKEISIYQETWLWIYTVHKIIPVSNPYEISSKTLNPNEAT